MGVYKVWQVDCEACGTVISYGQDESTLPEVCEECGTPIDKPEE